MSLSPSSDLDEFDENENILHRAQAQQEVSNNLTVSDHFTRLVWIDPNSPTLQRKGVIEEPAKDDKSGLEDDEEKEDPRTAYEQDNTSEAAGKGINCSDSAANFGMKKEFLPN